MSATNRAALSLVRVSYRLSSSSSSAPSTRSASSLLAIVTCSRSTLHGQRSLQSRAYATHRDTSSSLLAKGLERAQKGSASGSGGRLGGDGGDSVGPFALGITPGSSSFGGGEKVKPWKELTPGGKVLRTTARASNLTVILLGASLSVILTYALATELFAKNSPTKLYNEACEKIKESNALTPHLPPPLTFHTNPPSSTAPRHRNRYPQSHTAYDAAGNEHLLLHFWITSHGQNPSSAHDSQTWSDWFQNDWEWDQEHFDEGLRSIRRKMSDGWEHLKQSAAYVSGISGGGSSTPITSRQALEDVPVVRREEAEEKIGWSVVGLFKNMRVGGKKARDEEANGGRSIGDIKWESGEVHVDFIKDANGVFQYRYLLVDVPNSRVRRPARITIEKGQGFRETDGVFMWS